jgi:hypothetical protein
MTDERGVIRSISWRDLFPWLILLRTFRIAVQPPLLAVATAAVLLMSFSWWAGGWIFLPKEWDEEGGRYIVQYPAEQHPTLAELVPPAMRDYLPSAASGLVEPFLGLAQPWRRLFHLEFTIRKAAYYVFGSLVSLAVWALAGGFITRYAVQELAEHEPDLAATARFAARRYLWYFIAPLYPMLGIVLIGLPIALLGIPIYFAPGVGSIIAGLMWIFVVVASLAAAWLLAGLLFGWPLMWPAVSAERDGDAFEAFSRSFAYVYGRPLHYFFYVVVAALLGALGLAAVHLAALLVTEFGFWALAWGAGGQNVAAIRSLVELVLAGADLSGQENQTLVFGASLMAIVVFLVRTVETAFTFTYFWCVASAIYLLLRMDVDEKEMDEIHLESDPRASPKPLTTAVSAAANPAPAPATAPQSTASPPAAPTAQSAPSAPPEPIDD